MNVCEGSGDSENQDNNDDQLRELNQVLKSKSLSEYTNYDDYKINEWLYILLNSKVLHHFLI